MPETVLILEIIEKIKAIKIELINREMYQKKKQAINWKID